MGATMPYGGLFPEWTWIVGFLIGTFFGSFLNVVIYRMPRGLPLGRPAYSFCPSCKAQLGIADLMPLFSWLSTKGRCRYCGSRVSPRYFWVELATGVGFGAVWWQYLSMGSDPARAIAYAAFISALVAIIFIDAQFYIIPDEINAFLWFVGIAFNVYLYATGSPEASIGGWPVALIGWLTGVALLWGVAFLGRLLFRKDAMGHGDIKMTRGMGAILGPWITLLAIGVAVVLGAVIGSILKFGFRRAEEVVVKEGEEGDVALAEAGETTIEDEAYEPESFGSLIRCGIGYVLLFDIVGLFLPRFYERYFGESPFEPVDEEDTQVDISMIPFGPYLALGAIVAVVFQAQLLGLVQAYMRWIAPG